MHVPPPPPSKIAAHAEIPPQLDELVLACLAKSPDDRPPGVHAMIEVLATLAESLRWSQVDAKNWWQEKGELAALTLVDSAQQSTRRLIEYATRSTK
jgi:hypothetical protein